MLGGLDSFGPFSGIDTYNVIHYIMIIWFMLPEATRIDQIVFQPRHRGYFQPKKNQGGPASLSGKYLARGTEET
jgi:hypothetical protein